MMQDTKRATGRTTRMLLKATEKLIKDKGHVVIVAHDINGMQWLRQYAYSIVSKPIYDRMKFMTYRCWQEQGIGKRDDYFFDHHCFYTERWNLENQLKAIQEKMERVNEDYHKYDA